MNNCSIPALPRSVPLVRPLSQRLVDRWLALKGWWVERARQRREARDIGAPDWLQAHAQSRREAQLQRLQEARLGLEHRPLGDRW
jgi:hypothetical protein